MSKQTSLEDSFVVEKPEYHNREVMRDNHRTESEDYDVEEVDIWDLVRIVWNGRFIIVIIALLFAGAGAFHVSNGPTEYVSDAVLLQEAEGQRTSSAERFLQNFGGTFGFSQTETSGSLSVGMMTRILQSEVFLYEFIYEELEFDRFDEPMTIYEFFNNHYETPFRNEVYSFLRRYTIEFPGIALDYILNFKLFESEEEVEEVEEVEELIPIDERLLSFSSDQRRPISQLSSRISMSIDGNFVTVQTQMPDRKAAAMLNVLAIDRIQEYVVDYQLEKARQNLGFIRNQKEQAKERYEEAQTALAEFRDGNINLSTNIARTEEERLSNQRNLTFNIYNSIAVELEQAQLRLQEETPIFTVMQKSSLPTSSLGSSNRLVVVLFILGGIIGVALVFGVKIYTKIEEEVIRK
ncbi:MAG: hypothetical protein JJU13_21300 [Balneolaceae bacterium]|nr:hypothetical protein [Balneolaceae bacterium]